MKRIALIILLIVIFVTVLYWGHNYLKFQENQVNALTYTAYVNEERERKNENIVEEKELDTFTTYTGKYIFLTKVYTDHKFEMIFLTKATKRGIFF